MDVIHLLVGRSAVFFCFVCGIWGVLAHFRKAPDDSRYTSTLIIAEVLLVAQAILGVTLILSGRMPPDPMHIAYGALAAIVLPAVYGWANGRGARLALPTGIAMLFIGGLAIRAFTTSVVGFAGLISQISR